MTTWISGFILVLVVFFIWMLPNQETNSIYIPANKQDKDQPIEKKPKTSRTIQVMKITLPPPPPVKELNKIDTSGARRQASASSPTRTISFLKARPKKLSKLRTIKTRSSVKEIQPMKPEAKQIKIISDSRSIEARAPSRNASITTINPIKLMVEGRSLLRLLEHGKGPLMEISWPASPARQRTLYNLFKKCYGMRIALIDREGNMFKGQSRRGDTWIVNQDRYSGFVRKSSSGEIWDEQLTAKLLRKHHGLANANSVRLFPRQVDAFLLGGFKALVGDKYGQAKHIQAHYRVIGSRVFVGEITIDTRPVTGQIDLSGSAVRRCRI